MAQFLASRMAPVTTVMLGPVRSNEPRADKESAPAARPAAASRWVLLGIVVLAVALRIYWGTRPRIVWGDEPFYLWLGQSLLSGGGYQFFGISGVHFSPLFPLLAGLIGRLGALFGAPDPQALATGSVAVYVLCGALFVVPIHAIARRLAGERAALAAGLCAAVAPPLTAGIPLWGTMTEPLYLLLVAVGWWSLLVALQEDRVRADILAGVFLGLAYLTRTEALVYIIAGAGVLFLLRLAERPGLGFARAIARLGLTVVVFMLVISPYLILLKGETGRWQLAEEAGSTYVSAQSLARGDMAAFDRATWGLDPKSGEVYLFSPSSESQGLVDAVRANPMAFLRLVRLNLRDLPRTLFSLRLVNWVLAPCALLGLFACRWSRRRLEGELLLLASLAGPISFLPFFIQDRYIAGALLPALIWAGIGVEWIGQWLVGSTQSLWGAGTGSRRQMLKWVPTATVVICLLALTPSLWDRLHQTRSFQPNHMAAALVLAQRSTDPAAVLMSRYPAVAFHAGLRWTPTPAAAWAEVSAYARRKGAQFVTIDGWEATLRPELAPLLDPATAPPDVQHLATLSGSDPMLLYQYGGSR